MQLFSVYKPNKKLVIKPQIKKLTFKSKDIYRLFNIQQLQMCRLVRQKTYIQLIGEIKDFNQQLKQWKSQKHQIRNIVGTYNLYENLFSRMKYISILSNKQQQSTASCKQALRWFISQKPKVRNFIPVTKPELKPFTIDEKQQVDELETVINQSQVKKQLQPYRMMSRTTHSEIFPPSDRIKQFRRKQFIPINQQKPIQSRATSEKKITNYQKLSSLKQNKITFKQTTTTFKETTTTFNTGSKASQEKIEGDKIQQLREKQIQYQKIDTDPLKIINQEQIIKEQVDKAQQSDEDKDQVDQVEEEDQQQFRKQGIKKFSKQPDQLLMTWEKTKINNQSTIRKVVNYNKQKYLNKLEDLNIKKNMVDWAQVNGKFSSQEAIKFEKAVSGNQYKKLKYTNNNELSTKKINNSSKKTINDVSILYRSKSSHPGSIENDVNKIKIKQELKRYGRHINHLQPESYKDYEPQQQYQQALLTKYRGSSLTSHNQRYSKKKTFQAILLQNNLDIHNQQAQQNILCIKSALSTKLIPIDNQSIFRSISIPQCVDIKAPLYKTGSNLVSNPYFPKHLFVQTNKKKKKK